MIFPYRIETEIEKSPIFTYFIIGANALIFFILLGYPQPIRELFYHDYGFTPEESSVVSLFTAMFFHSGWVHLIGNMYFFWLFGRAVEQRITALPCALLYFSSGIVGSLLQGAFSPDYLTDVSCVGASGAISGLLGAYAALYPNEEVDCLYFSFTLRYATSITLPAILVLGSWFAYQSASAMWLSSYPGESMVAFWAHIGGFAFGAILPLLIAHSGAFALKIRRRAASITLEEYSDLFHAKKYDEAAAKLNEALKREPNDPLILGEQAKMELRRKNTVEGTKLLQRALESALKQKDDAKAISAYLALSAAGANPTDNARRLVIARRFVRRKKYAHALGILQAAFQPGGKVEGLDKLIYEIAEIFAGPLDDHGRAQAAYSLLKQLFPHSPRSLDAEYQLRKLRAKGKTVFG